ncbi:MAG: glycosyltransferase family 1 protein, partial [Dolichospermum sp.]
ILQWDSWRFWESLAAGCVTFHVDFEKYGITLPVMPENWRHYIGVDLDHVQTTVDRIAENPEILEYITQEGRSWAIKNYSPVPTALRFLEIVSQKQTTTKSSLSSHAPINVKY